MVDALEAQAQLAELRRAFVDEARDAAHAIDAGAPMYAMEDVHAYLLERIAASSAGRRRHPERPEPLTQDSATRPKRKPRPRSN